jgi:hypothetical protein
VDDVELDAVGAAELVGGVEARERVEDDPQHDAEGDAREPMAVRWTAARVSPST